MQWYKYFSKEILQSTYKKSLINLQVKRNPSNINIQFSGLRSKASILHQLFSLLSFSNSETSKVNMTQITTITPFHLFLQCFLLYCLFIIVNKARDRRK